MACSSHHLSINVMLRCQCQCQGLKFSLIAVTVLPDDPANEEDSLSGGDRPAVPVGQLRLSLSSNMLRQLKLTVHCR